MNETIGWIKGYICIIIENVMYAEPVRYKNWFPCYRMKESWYKDQFEGLKVRATALNGEYLVTGKNPFDKKGYLYLQDGGSTKSIHSENFLIPCPKVRKGIETRWNGYYWQKLLKKGWVSA